MRALSLARERDTACHVISSVSAIRYYIVINVKGILCFEIILFSTRLVRITIRVIYECISL